jgi:SAM-dependent methyltransferase
MERAEELRRAVREKYREVSVQPEGPFPYPVGRASAVGLGYEPEWLEAVPADALERFVGVGNPFSVRRPERGARVLDLGCGSGVDVFVAAQLVGAEGRAVGVDLTPEMLAWARRHATGNVELHEAMIEDLPFPDASFDLAISNGALNLVPDKDAAFREIFRVLKPGGGFAVADLLVTTTVPEEVLKGLDAWST